MNLLTIKQLFFTNYSKISRFIKYGIGCSFSIIIKITLTNLFVHALLVPAKYSYLLVHIILTFFSFFFHTKITFKRDVSIKLFQEYCLSVIAFKIIDYLIFLLGIKMLETYLAPILPISLLSHTISLSILLSTMLIFLVRFAVYNNLFSKEKTN